MQYITAESLPGEYNLFNRPPDGECAVELERIFGMLNSIYHQLEATTRVAFVAPEVPKKTGKK